MNIAGYIPPTPKDLEHIKRFLEDPNRKYNSEFERNRLLSQYKNTGNRYGFFLILGRSARSGFEILGGDLEGDDEESALTFIGTLQPQAKKILEDLKTYQALTYIYFETLEGEPSHLFKYWITDDNLKYYRVPPLPEPFKVLK